MLPGAENPKIPHLTCGFLRFETVTSGTSDRNTGEVSAPLSQTMYWLNGFSEVNFPTTYCLLLLIVNIENNKLTVLWGS